MKDGGLRDIPVEEVKMDYERKSNTVTAYISRIDVVWFFRFHTISLLLEEYMENVRSIVCNEKKGHRCIDAHILGTKLKETGIEKERIRIRGSREH